MTIPKCPYAPTIEYCTGWAITVRCHESKSLRPLRERAVSANPPEPSRKACGYSARLGDKRPAKPGLPGRPPSE